MQATVAQVDGFESTGNRASQRRVNGGLSSPGAEDSTVVGISVDAQSTEPVTSAAVESVRLDVSEDTDMEEEDFMVRVHVLR